MTCFIATPQPGGQHHFYAHEHDERYVVGNLTTSGSVFAELQRERLHSLHPDGLRAWLENHWRSEDLPKPTVVVEEHPLQPGQFYPRMWRSDGENAPVHQLCAGALRDTWRGVWPLVENLKDLLSRIDPDHDDMVSGAQPRQILILAATEVENAWRGLLAANGHPATNPNTTVYQQLLRPMALDMFQVRLPLFPGYPPFFPFEGWKSDEATKSLPWYDAYNGAKHHRTGNRDCSTLRHAIHATGAALVMLHAQFGFGWEGVHRMNLPEERLLESFVKECGLVMRVGVDRERVVIPAQDLLIPPVTSATNPGAGEWTPVNYFERPSLA